MVKLFEDRNVEDKEESKGHIPETTFIIVNGVIIIAAMLLLVFGF